MRLAIALLTATLAGAQVPESLLDNLEDVASHSVFGLEACLRVAELTQQAIREHRNASPNSR